MEVKRVIGLMSGTSMDGIDVVLMETDGEEKIDIKSFLSISYEKELRDKIRIAIADVAQCSSIDFRIAGIQELEHEITKAHAAAVNKLMQVAEVSAEEIDLVGFHGHTILHRPELGFTWQLGDGKALAHLLGIDVVSDFRSSDVEHGGQGAPLAPLYHRAIAQSANLGAIVAILNLGGVGNVTWLDLSSGEQNILAFDTGPGNALIDDWMMKQTGADFDKDGAAAAKGSAHSDYLLQWMSNPYFLEPAPKSLDRNSFSIDGIENLSTNDGAASLTAFTVASVKMALLHMPKEPEVWYVTGGGRKNDTMMTLLGAVLGAPVSQIEALGFNGDSIEAEAFAYLAARSYAGLPTSVPDTTGVSKPIVGGVIHSAKSPQS